MKIANSLIALLLISPVLWAKPQSSMQKMGLTSQVCFVQPEVSGRMNVEESRVSLSNYQSVTLMGGETACLYVYPGTNSFRFGFLNSENLFPRKSISLKYDVILKKGKRAVFELYPATKNGEYTSGWRARLIQRDTDKG
jgi:hypothetical protein